MPVVSIVTNVPCKYCGSFDVRLNGFDRARRRKYYCCHCHHRFTPNVPCKPKPTKKSSPLVTVSGYLPLPPQSRHCAKCGGDIVPDDELNPHCLQCGVVFVAPQTTRASSLRLDNAAMS